MASKIVHLVPFHRSLTVVFSLVLILCSDFTLCQHNWNKPVTTPVARRSVTNPTAATTSAKAETHSVARKSSDFSFPEDDDFGKFSTNKRPQQFNQIPMELLNELNSAADWSDFLKHVDNVTVIHGETEADQLRVYGTWETDIDARSNLGQERDGAIPAKAAHCIPELQTVPLIANTDPTVLFYPACTRIERCGGCCSSDLLACEPTKTETVLFQVLKTQYAGGTRMKFAGKESVPVEKHTACKCQCKVKESHCTANQVYVPASCRCECANIDDRRKCESENQTRYWDSRFCMCRCRDDGIVQQCSTGFYYNENVCRCEPWVNRRRDFDSPSVFPIEREDQNPPIYNEDNNNNVHSIERRPTTRAILKKEDNIDEEEEKKSRPVERFQFANYWNLNKRKN